MSKSYLSQSKSFAINEFRKRIEGSKQFERLLSKQTDEEALFGRIDLKSLIDGNPKMITTGKIPDSDIVFLDEIFKSNEGVLNSLLTALNERRYTNESETVNIPVVSFMSASNEIPNFNDPAEKILKPLYDRFELKVVTQYITSRQERLNMLLRKQNGKSGQSCETIKLSELYAMQIEVAAVSVPIQINELMDDVLCELRRLGIHVSDRKYLNYYPIVQAKAWLNGQNMVQSSDLLALKNYLWTTPEETSIIENTLVSFCVNPLQEKLNGFALMSKDSYDEFLQSEKNTKAFIKFRGEFLKLFGMIKESEAQAVNDNERTMTANAVECLEIYSRHAHDVANFTYAPLEELQMLA